MISSVTGNLCNKCPKWLVEQNSSYSDYFNVISGFTSNSRAPGGPVTVTFDFFTVYTTLVEMVLLASKDLTTVKQSYLQWG